MEQAASSRHERISPDTGLPTNQRICLAAFLETMTTAPQLLVNPIASTRRQFLGASALAGLGLFWTDWLRAASSGQANGKAKARSVILIFNCGAPSHIDLWDMKPEGPV